MEFTEKEIEMFGKAKELQADWKPQVGDCFYKADGLGQGSWMICIIIGETLWCIGEAMRGPVFKNRLVEFRVPENYTWIPSLETLLNMVVESAADAQDIGRILSDFTVGDPPMEISEFASRLRLSFLAIFMWKKYDWKWDGKIWRKRAKK